MKAKTIFSILLLGITASFSTSAQELKLKDLSQNLTGKEVWGKSWKISHVEKRKIDEKGSIGELNEMELDNSSLGHFMANTRLPDSITFKINHRFNVNLFTANFWEGASDSVPSFKWTAGIWKLKKNMLIWECPDNLLFDAKITEFGKEFFVISGVVEYGAEASEYFEYKVKYELVDDGMMH
ncbi:MAG: hypothetical protein GY810_04320 [Aureispira sp.]|nr:hypothetical protein [Aureispira sp.]